MTESKIPMDCRHYPACDYLKQASEEIPSNLVVIRRVFLLRKAWRICIQCPEFESEPHIDHSPQNLTPPHGSESC